MDFLKSEIDIAGKLAENVGKVGRGDLDEQHLEGGHVPAGDTHHLLQLATPWDVKQRLVGVGKNSGHIDLVRRETLPEVTEHGGDGNTVEVKEEEHGGKEEGDLPDGDE